MNKDYLDDFVGTLEVVLTELSLEFEKLGVGEKLVLGSTVKELAKKHMLPEAKLQVVASWYLNSYPGVVVTQGKNGGFSKS